MISDWIAQAASGLGENVSWLPKEKVARLIASIVDGFTRPMQEPYHLWESFVDDISRKRIDGWQRLCDYPEDQPIMLYQEQGDFEGVAFPSTSVMQHILTHSPGFEFYVTNESVGFVLCFNHHDYLIGVGACKPWLSSIPEDLVQE